MSRPASSFPAPPSRRDSAYTRRQTATPAASGSAPPLPPAAQWTVVSDGNGASSTSNTFDAAPAHLARTHRPATLNLTSSTRIEPALGSPLSLAPSHTSDHSASTDPESPTTPAPPNAEAARHAKMQRITRRLGEGVPAALVFPDAAAPARASAAQDEEAPLLARRRQQRRNTMHTKPQVKSREPIRAWNGPIPFDEMAGPFIMR